MVVENLGMPRPKEEAEADVEAVAGKDDQNEEEHSGFDLEAGDLEDEERRDWEEELQRLQRFQLAQMCANMGISSKGDKETLVRRLVPHMSGDAVALWEYDDYSYEDDANNIDSDMESDDDESHEEEEQEEEEQQQQPELKNNEYCFDKSNHYKLVDTATLAKQPEHMVLTPTLDIVDETQSLLQLIPPEYATIFDDKPEYRKHLMEVVMDVGRKPFAWVKGERIILSEQLVDTQVLQKALGNLKFGTDNRAGLNRCLHRISAMRNRDGQIVGATLRAGRYVPGNAMMIADLLFGINGGGSILFVGPPGSAKTSIVRDAAHALSQQKSVVIVDTSNEIAGAGDIPHECIGMSRRMQVPSLNQQVRYIIMLASF